MDKKPLFLLLALACAALLFTQSTVQAPAQQSLPASPGLSASFTVFMARQDSLFLLAYHQKDIPLYQRLLKESEERYERLPETDKKKYTQYRAGSWYNLACAYGIRQQNSKALDALEKAIGAGYCNYSHALADEDLAGIRDSVRFQTILAPLRATGDYLYILGKAGYYNEKDLRPLPPFQYEPAADSALTALRTGLHLDSIAGEGSDVSRVLRLLHWMHDLIPHDGQHENPSVRNAMSLIARCRREHRGLNCRGLAIALNECYLALGFPSRYVTCLPKDSLKTDNDCHVINLVYLSSLKKWVWIDPTNDAYVMNEKGELLSIEEVRQRLIDHRMLIVNPDANWNHRSAVVKEHYLYNYMAKNLYMLECPVRSGYDLETAAEGKTHIYIRLLPLDYFEQGPDKVKTNWPMHSTYINYHTNNAAKFWALPD